MFKLSENFISQYEGQQPDWGFGDLSYFVYKKNYARKKDNGLQEEWWETCQRVIETEFNIQKDHCDKTGLPWNAHKAQLTAQESYRRMFAFKWLPPGRGISNFDYGRLQKLKSSASWNNCAWCDTACIKQDLAAPFRWVCDALMNGVGVGFSTAGAGLVTIQKPLDEVEVFVIPDSRQGWAESVYQLVNSYTGNKPTIVFDYSLIRPAGAELKTFGGTASGPDPLRRGHKAIAAILDALVDKPITSTTIVDIMNHIGVFVVAGGTRRSAELALGELDDLDYLEMKDPKKYAKELGSHRYSSNNSVIVRDGDDISHTIPQLVKNGEPGFFFIDNARHFGRMKDGYYPEGHDKCEAKSVGVNPCSEQILEHMELCTLTELFPANHDSIEDFKKTIKVAYLYAKTVTLVPTHWKETNQVMLRNRRIGLSQSGIQQALKKFGPAKYFAQFCDQAYDYVTHLDKIYSRWLGCPTSIRRTSVKPSGSISLLAGATPGVHCTHSEYYLRSVRVEAIHPMVRKLLKAGYRISFDNNHHKILKEAIKESGQNWKPRSDHPLPLDDFDLLTKYGNKGGNLVVYFPIKEENFTKSKDEISLWEQLVLVKELQHYWSDNSVSVTVTFKPEEAKDIYTAIEFFSPHVKSLSFLPLTDHQYEQAPYQTITKEEYEEYNSSLKKLNLASLRGGDARDEKFCNNDSCQI